MRRNTIFFSAGVLAVLTAAVHTFVGTLEIHSPLLNSPLPEPIRLLLYACWHLVTVTLILSAVALLVSSRNRLMSTELMLPAFVGILWLLFGLVFIVVALIFSGVNALLILPQWILLIPVGGLALWGSLRRY